MYLNQIGFVTSPTTTMWTRWQRLCTPLRGEVCSLGQ